MYLVQQPDPNQPKPEGAQMLATRGEQLGVVTNWPPSLEAALQRWGTISPKAPCLTTMDTNGKPLYILTYGNPIMPLGSLLDLGLPCTDPCWRGHTSSVANYVCVALLVSGLKVDENLKKFFIKNCIDRGVLTLFFNLKPEMDI